MGAAPSLFFHHLERFAMLRRVGLLEHLEVTAAASDHLDEAAARVIVLLVLLEVVGKSVNLLGQHCYLHLFRAGVSGMRLVLLDNCLLFLGGKHDGILPHLDKKSKPPLFLPHRGCFSESRQIFLSMV